MTLLLRCLFGLGIFYEAGKEPGPGQEPKLHLLIESNDEFRVKLAVDELKRILLEASIAALVSFEWVNLPESSLIVRCLHRTMKELVQAGGTRWLDARESFTIVFSPFRTSLPSI